MFFYFTIIPFVDYHAQHCIELRIEITVISLIEYYLPLFLPMLGSVAWQSMSARVTDSLFNLLTTCNPTARRHQNRNHTYKWNRLLKNNNAHVFNSFLPACLDSCTQEVWAVHCGKRLPTQCLIDSGHIIIAPHPVPCP